MPSPHVTDDDDQRSSEIPFDPVAAQQDALRFIEAKFEADDLIEIRGRNEKAGRIEYRDWCKASDFKTKLPELLARNAKGTCIWAGANPRRCRGGLKADVMLARDLHADFDHATIDDALNRILVATLPDPFMLTTSGKGVHAYWRLREPWTDSAAWEQLERDMAALLRSDRKVCEWARCMRIPGFLNHKHLPAPQARIFRCHEPQPIYFEDLRAIVNLETASSSSGDTECAEEPEYKKPSSSLLSSNLIPPPPNSVNSAHSVSLSLESAPSATKKMTAQEVIQATLPKGPGRRNGSLMELARGIKLNLGMDIGQLKAIKAIVKEWHRLASPYILTKSFEDSWDEFLAAFASAWLPLGGSVIKTAISIAERSPVPQCVKLVFDTHEIEDQGRRKLVMVLYNLSGINGGGKFYISCRDAAEVMGRDRVKDFKLAARFLHTLEDQGIIECTDKGIRGFEGGKAARYIWKGAPQTAAVDDEIG